MSVIVCASCCDHIDTDETSLADPEFKLCDACYEAQWTCKECGEPAADPDEDPPAKRLTCRQCHEIGRADYERDRRKDERAERRAGVR